MLAPELSRVLAGIRAAAAPCRARTRIIAVDGPGGAGKGSLDDFLAHELGAPVVRTDDLADWHNPVDWSPAVIESVLEPLTTGGVARYTPTTWGGPPKSGVVVGPGDLVLLEGVSSARAAFRPFLAYSIWIETPPELRLRRGLERDGDEALPSWQRWMAEEDAWIARERPAEHADVVLPGDADLWA